MGEVVMCSTKEGVMEAVEQMRKEESEQIMDGRTNNTSNKEGTSNSVIRWEKFLPRMVLRVLLVEADDSTRQIISALLRKCSYKVAAVDDGLKAWELLKGRPHSFDLILTEVELPSISGFALLTLIMEHNICKNTPVIMMSSHDSVGTVYKCMMRGAADFLMKPIRINELKNLWQHVWRRQSAMSNGLEPQDESVAQQQHQKLEATAENNDAAVNDHSSGSKRVALRQEDCLKKGSDDQSSCTKPDLEDESASVEKDDADRVMPREKCDRSPVTDTKAEEAALFQSSETSQNMNNQDYIVSGLDFAGSRISNEINNGDDGSHEEMRNHRNAANYIHSAEAACLKTTDSQAESSRQAIDLIGTLNNNRSNNCSSFGGLYGLFGVGNPGVLFETPELNLSLRRLPQDGENNNLNLWQNNNTLVRSNASAFSRYVNKQVQQPSSVVVSAFSPREGQITSTDHSSNHMSSEPAGTSTPKFTQQRLYPIPVPMKGVQKLNPDDRPYKFDQTTIKTVQIDQQRLDSLDDRVINASSATDHNGSGSLCNNGAEFITGRHLNRCGSISGSNGNNNNKSNNVGTSGGGGATFWNSGAESGNEESFMSARERSCHRSILREAALTKFRLKRKERCFEKKVRYESRKKLAEQRPRVKGQFVRQLPADPPPSLVAANPE